MLSIFRNDLRTISRNVMASVMIFGLVVIPLLFTWFNVLASWNPFGNTSQLKVAVASEDSGYTSDLLPIPVNVGDQVLNQLRANDKLDWVVTTADDAVEGAKSGEYYAAIVLPQTFSTDMMTFYAGESDPAEISVYTNEKKNALAPKITGQGAEGVSSQIAQTFTRTVGDVSLDLVTSLSDFLNAGDTKNALSRIEARADAVERQLQMGARTARSLEDLVESATPLMQSAQDIIGSARVDLPELNSSSLELSTDALTASLDATSASYDVVGDKLDALFDDAAATRESRVATLNTLAGQVQGTIDAYTRLRETVNTTVKPVMPAQAAALLGQLDEAIAAQEAVHDRLVAAAQAPAPTKPDFSALDKARDSIAGIQTSPLRDSLRQLRSSLQAVGQDLQTVETPISIDSSSLNDARDAIAKLADMLEGSASKFSSLRAEIDKAADSGDLTKLAELVGSNPDALASSIAAPVSVSRHAVYPVVSFGAGMAALYTALALWVGAMLTSVAVRTDVTDKSFGPIQRYFGRFGTFALVGFLQSTLLMLGLIFFVRVEPAHPFLLLVAGWVTSLVFMFICYTLVVSFANAGKALGVLLLVMQISTAGGAYPLDVLPQWFQNLSPWMPATYAIRAYRAANAGIYQGDFWLSILCLLLFILPMLVLGVALHKPLAKFTQGWIETLEKTKLM
ncbi:YhgE/Pip domain-containing protein [uncultured Corynebacterium sp.]|uniref:YhgE/Pip domain-containing protein n=1 Tax=uncultured Corynebacterium sp. TaxID=159447 RepID=UPI0025EFFE62|nr:YhgE/Pip domain-containing protein [uncultured Corynebacterium sp.]